MLNKENVGQVLDVMHSKHLQDSLMSDHDDPNRWMLDYVFDSALQEKAFSFLTEQ